ncbi:MAG TPA: nitrilase-related carbon-nitrogen hydrolase [Opitutaceae bacterium]
MQVVAIQYDIAWEDRAANIEAVRRLTALAAPQPGALVVLPEMGLTGFSMAPDKVADTELRETESAICALAREHQVHVLGGMVCRAPDGRGRNQAMLATPAGGLAAVYTKIHPFSHTGEHRKYEAGSEVVVAPCGPFQLAPFVCYDLRFPEIFRTAARRGATLIAVIANWPEARHAHWQTLLQARAIENQCWVIGVNRCGRDPKFNYLGGTVVVDPFGRVSAAAGDTEVALTAEMDPVAVLQLREAFPVLEDLRPQWTRG